MAHNLGLRSINYGLLYGIVAPCLGFLGFLGRFFAFFGSQVLVGWIWTRTGFVLKLPVEEPMEQSWQKRWEHAGAQTIGSRVSLESHRG